MKRRLPVNMMRLIRLVIGAITKPESMPQAPKGETCRETVALVFDAYTWNARVRSAAYFLGILLGLFSIWQAVERFWPR